MFSKILIANRGEIAVRIARTARRMGVATVAVYSEADRGAPHVAACDEAVFIGAAAAAESYLRADRILEAMRRTGAEALHPGYGFLSENADFAEALEREGLVFIGPKASSIRAMGSKSAAKDLMEKAGVPTLKGYQGADQSVEAFRLAAAAIGYPVLLKAAAGGGGKGMRLVERAEDLEDALRSAQREAKSAFGDDRFLVEKYLARPRHVEVQVFGDTHGEIVHLFERDCSVQRRHQKIIEEAPAPNLPESARARFHSAAVAAARAVDYVGAGTIEFLYDPAAKEGGVYFMEMNTRLQVEHPVTEAITGLDLVEWQLRVAAGEPLPLRQHEIRCNGHAFEARLYAEDPDRNFAPSIGTLSRLALPTDVARVDSGVAEGQTITPYYDPMIAKIVTHGANRKEALARLAAALRETRVAGPETNARFLHALACEPRFASGDISTRHIEETKDTLFSRPVTSREALAVALHARATPARAAEDPWDRLAGFRLNKPAKRVLWIEWEGAPAMARLYQMDGEIRVEIESNAGAAARRKGETPGARFAFSFLPPDRSGRFTVEGRSFAAETAPHGKGLRVFIGAETFDFVFPDPLSGEGGHHAAAGSLTAPMPGVITAHAAGAGAKVAAGAALLVMEAMKMEHSIRAPSDGVVKSFRFKPGDQVKEGDLLVEFEETA